MIRTLVAVKSRDGDGGGFEVEVEVEVKAVGCKDQGGISILA